MDLLTFLAQLVKDGVFAMLAGAGAAQFGPPQRPYLGATILPERLTEENSYRESGIRYMTVIANDGSRYSPAQKKDGGEIVGSFLVELGDSDIAREFTGRDYDALLRLLARAGANPTMEAAAQVIRWADQTLNRALVELNEKQRWDALVAAQVVRRGDNGYVETVVYPNPTGHRVAAAGTWSNDAYDPLTDIFAMADLLTGKGYAVSRIVTSTRVMRILEGNQIVARRFAGVRVLSASEVFDRVNRDNINAGFQRNGLPAPETYDLTYRDQASRKRFLPDDGMVFLSETGRDETVEIADGVRYLPDTVGYTAIGRAVGQPAAGRVIRVEAHADKPPRLQGEAWQTSLPVVTEPEAIGYISSIA